MVLACGGPLVRGAVAAAAASLVGGALGDGLVVKVAIVEIPRLVVVVVTVPGRVPLLLLAVVTLSLVLVIAAPLEGILIVEIPGLVAVVPLLLAVGLVVVVVATPLKGVLTISSIALEIVVAGVTSIALDVVLDVVAIVPVIDVAVVVELFSDSMVAVTFFVGVSPSLDASSADLDRPLEPGCVSVGSWHLGEYVRL